MVLSLACRAVQTCAPNLSTISALGHGAFLRHGGVLLQRRKRVIYIGGGGFEGSIDLPLMLVKRRVGLSAGTPGFDLDARPRIRRRAMPSSMKSPSPARQQPQS